ncbi:MAG: ABC transporter ATP-binding protein, partial [Candidatus Marinimicrobia bacterium]|nr:ABC transporter ATP-binding protein [Candidatus Neomarinimicrobiota bacterium]
KPDTGFIKLNGKDINSKDRTRIGYLPEDRGLYQKQRLLETICYFGMLKGFNKFEAHENTKTWLNRFSLENQENRKIEELSKGNQQKVQFIIALLNDPDLLILDEPFTGLDPINQLLLKEIIQEKAQAGKTIIFSTHQMEQVERLCSNISLINKGKIILEGELRAVKDSKKTKAIEVVFDGKVDIEKVENYLENVIVKENFVSGIVKKDHRSFLNWINKIVDVESFQVKIPTLEQIFIDEVRESR